MNVEMVVAVDGKVDEVRDLAVVDIEVIPILGEAMF